MNNFKTIHKEQCYVCCWQINFHVGVISICIIYYLANARKNSIHLKLNAMRRNKKCWQYFPFNFHDDFICFILFYCIFSTTFIKCRRIYDLTISSNLYAKSGGTSSRNELSLFVLISIESIQQKWNLQ